LLERKLPLVCREAQMAMPLALIAQLHKSMMVDLPRNRLLMADRLATHYTWSFLNKYKILNKIKLDFH
jgi:hypothetical protein